jgi:CheY-like chemotaxis protein
VIGDPAAVREVLANLVANAIKFTETGEVLVCAELEEESSDTAVVRLEVSDTGIGIAPELHGRLFQPFWPDDYASSRQYSGTGLGLAVSRHLVELMGGDIGFDSAPGKGSTFWFTLRFKKTVTEGERASVFNEKALAGSRVLVVDDSPGHRDILRRRLTELNVVNEESATGEGALSKIQAAVHPFDVALIDMKMPGMNGIELARAIRALVQPPPTKLVLMTPFSQRSCKQAATDAGFSAILDKPLRDWYLRETLGQLISVQCPEPPAQATPPTEKSGRDVKGRVLIADDNPVNQRIAARLVENLGYATDAVANGRECLEAVERFQYGLILMDCQMPLMDGFEASTDVHPKWTNRCLAVSG